MTSFHVIVIVLSLAAIFGLITIVILCRQNASFFQKIATVTAVCSFIGIVAYLMEILSTSQEAALASTRFGYIGKSFAMTLFLIFTARYCDVKLPHWLVNVLLVFSGIMLVVVFTCPYHNLYYSSVDFVETGIFPHLVLGKGVLYYVFMVVTIGVMVGFMIISVKTLFKREGEDRRRLVLLTLSGFLPAIALTLNLLPFMKGFDPTPLGILCACCLVVYSTLRYGLLDTIQLASENVMDDTAAGLIVVSKAKNFVYANKTAYRIFPELQDDLGSRDIVSSLFEEVDKDNKEKKIFERDGIIYELNFSELAENSNKTGPVNNGYMAWIFDKTNDYNYTMELERLRVEAEEANKAKSVFLAKMSHEIRTPMNGIMGFVNLALDKKQDSETEEYLHYIKDSADSLLGIINDVLDISKIESGKMEIVNVEYNPNKLFQDVAVLFKNQAESKNLEFRCSLPDDMPRIIIGDNIRFREILVNIVGNAIKYTNKGYVEFDVNIKSKNDSGLVFEITVKDTGVGIKSDRMEGIFNIFEQADKVGNYNVEGTGLGLPIAKQLIEMMGGSITVSSEYGFGSEFRLIVPQKYTSNQDKKIIEKKEKYTGGEFTIVAKGVNILLVDDNLINLRVEKGLLEKYKLDVDLCESGIDCLEMVKEKRYDIILMDHMMPGMDGVETMQKIRETDNPNQLTPILLVTANALVGVEQDMINLGFNGFVSKPIDVATMEKELLRVLPSDKFEVLPVKSRETKYKKDRKDQKGRDLVEILIAAGINVENALKYCGDMDTYKEILTIAVNGFEPKKTAIEKYIEEEDYEQYKILVHSLKSGAANIGAEKLSEMAKNLEYAAKDGNIEYILENNQDMLDCYEETISVIAENLSDISQNNESEIELNVSEAPVEPEKSQSLLMTDWDRELKNIEYLLNELETEETVEIINRLLSEERYTEGYKLLMDMRDNLLIFDIDGAKARLQSLKGISIE